MVGDGDAAEYLFPSVRRMSDFDSRDMFQEQNDFGELRTAEVDKKLSHFRDGGWCCLDATSVGLGLCAERKAEDCARKFFERVLDDSGERCTLVRVLRTFIDEVDLTSASQIALELVVRVENQKPTA